MTEISCLFELSILSIEAAALIEGSLLLLQSLPKKRFQNGTSHFLEFPFSEFLYYLISLGKFYVIKDTNHRDPSGYACA